LCTKSALFTRLYRDARSTKHKIRLSATSSRFTVCHPSNRGVNIIQWSWMSAFCIWLNISHSHMCTKRKTEYSVESGGTAYQLVCHGIECDCVLYCPVKQNSSVWREDQAHNTNWKHQIQNLLNHVDVICVRLRYCRIVKFNNSAPVLARFSLCWTC
jgi:hypothetical protein